MTEFRFWVWGCSLKFFKAAMCLKCFVIKWSRYASLKALDIDLRASRAGKPSLNDSVSQLIAGTQFRKWVVTRGVIVTLR